MDNFTFHREHLLAGDGERMAELAGGRWQYPEICLPCLHDELRINKNTGEIVPFLGNKDRAALVYQYISEAVGIPGPGTEYIAFLQLPNGAHHNEPFRIDALTPLSKCFGGDLRGFARAAAAFGGQPVKGGDMAFQFAYFPKVYLQVIIWEADEEFPAQTGILFDQKSQFHMDTAGLFSVGIDLAMRLIEEAGR